VTGLTLDTGALVALERRDTRATALISAARAAGARITVPTAVLVEWWRGQLRPAARLLDAFVVEPLDKPIARVAGEALARTGKGPSPTDAVVMASAARRGDRVLTSDLRDLEQLAAWFPGVRLLRV
jgi:predicted nucleic acid-binding protein